MFNVNLLVPKIILVLSTATLASHLFIVLLIVVYIFGFNKKEPVKKYFEGFQKNAMLLAFVVALGATAGSLFFSEFADFQPCGLCWWQRVLLYPQGIIFGIAFWRKDYGARFYLISLSLIGAGIAGYQYISTLLAPVSPLGICSTGGPSCLTNYFTEFGYITSPLMSLTAFALIMVLSLIWKTDNQANN